MSQRCRSTELFNSDSNSNSSSNPQAGSISQWILDLQGGRDRSIQPLLNRTFGRLVNLARRHLCALGHPRIDIDEEDVALSAFQSFCDGVLKGRFPQVDDRDDLWRVLLKLTARKAIDQARHHRRFKRGGGSVANETDLATGPGQEEVRLFETMVGRELTPEFAAMVADEYRRRISALGDATLQRIAERKLACYTNGEIAGELGVSLRTVTLRLEMIRKRWSEEGGTR
jgi:DNA-directed RNA polymerase specialized sigma24 family protein